MRSIFLKIFMWFWLSTILSGLVFFLIAFNLRISPIRDERRRHFEFERQRTLSDAVLLYGSTAAAISEKEGSPAWVDARQQAARSRGYLFAADGTPLSQGVPQPVQEAVLGNIRPAAHPPGRVSVVVVKVHGPSGTPYLAAAALPSAPPPPELKPFPLPSHFWLQLLITFVVSGLACYGLSWRITAPVRRLRAAAQALAEGDLASRVPMVRGGSGDELTDLGRDFNLMAARIETLVQVHQQLVRDVSHELRSPLARLNVALGIARKKSPPSAATALDRIEYEGERLNLLIGELIALSKLEEGVAGEKGDIDLAGLVEEVARDAEFEACAVNRHVDFSLVTGLHLPGNRELLRRALENVVRNAVHYTVEGSSVEIVLERGEELQAVIRVRDFGPGVPQAQLSDIFRPFYRVGEARDRQSGGTGIGLAIAEKTVALHRGSIAARNIPGAGLEVEIRLPLPARS